MASRAASLRWLLRDLPRSYVLLVLIAFVVAILTYFIDWSTVRRETAVQARPNNVSNGKKQQFYTGSIVVPTRKHDLCLELMFNNRNGKMREKGYIKCDATEPHLAETIPPEETRLREIGKAFRHKAE